MHSLPIFVRLTGRPVILVGQGDGADAKRRLLERAGAVVVGADEDAAFAIVAIADDAEAIAAVEQLRARGILVNAVDRPQLCDFTLPAIVDRDPVLIAIGTGGASAGLAKIIRQRIEALLPPSVGALARALADARGMMRARWADSATRRRALDAALGRGGPLDPIAGADADSVVRWLDNGEGTANTGRLENIVLMTADPDDLTLRAARWLGEADVVFYAPDVPPSILDRARADAQRIASVTTPAYDGDGLALWITLKATS
ncbi:MAG: NAD(P)-dependent oxidoreductase [Sphingobium sp.]